MAKTRSSLLSIHNMEVRNRTIIIIVLLLLSLTGYFTERRLKYEIETSVRDSLEKTLRSNAEAMSLLLRGYKERINGISKIPQLQKTAHEIAQLHTSNSQDQLKQQTDIFENILKGFFSHNGFQDYYLINTDGRMMASKSNVLIGHQVNTAEAIESIMDKEGNFICLPKKATHPITGKKFVLMYIGTSLKNTQGQTYAYLAFSVEPSHGFSSIMEVTAQTGESSETYAINQDGWMISHSRFDQELRELKILDKDDPSSVLAVQLVDENGKALTVFEDAFSTPPKQIPSCPSKF